MQQYTVYFISKLLYMFRVVSPPIIRNTITVSTASGTSQPLLLPVAIATGSNNGCEQDRPDPARKLSTNLYDIHHCCVYSEKHLMMDKGTVRNM